MFAAAQDQQLRDNRTMKNVAVGLLLSVLLAFASACGARPPELVLAVGKPELVDAAAEFPRIRFGDGLISANDRCPVTKRKLSVLFPPVYVNGLPIGFC
jgi:hypothetical protein